LHSLTHLYTINLRNRRAVSELASLSFLWPNLDSECQGESGEAGGGRMRFRYSRSEFLY
jgi:hypothetical protein